MINDETTAVYRHKTVAELRLWPAMVLEKSQITGHWVQDQGFFRKGVKLLKIRILNVSLQSAVLNASYSRKNKAVHPRPYRCEG